MIIREITQEDAIELIKFQKQLDNETKFMLFEPNEREIDEIQQSKMIMSFLESNNSNIFIAESDHRIVGYLSVSGGRTKRIRHSAYIVIGILKDFTGKGMGSELFNAMEQWRLSTNIKRVELTVMTNNEFGIKLYKKMGFEIEGIKKNSMIVDDRFVDEYYMAKIY
ncbi:RimJ/RimL family protein N-acetyltransferase [Fontibacillus solani]|uniref:RimJ/RimL family protein N-acetyltransferase n=1 Tax=Fontibacillus solani TaxID=1572857 RepID=A0A7W3SVE3_9BACL|nr:GNAT family N-acetyltransferase [Fontibacillus solani]MBA9086849.1 RimJ/RimL family protein N-acetyltransferase [Fontibacillus solani]